MKFMLALLLLSLTPLPASAGEKETAFERVMKTGTLRCGFMPWPPGFEIDPNTKEVKGPTKDLFQSIINLIGWKVEWVEVVLGNETLDLENGKIDAMCAAGPWVISNVRFVDYTTPAVYSPIFVYGRADDVRLNTLGDLDKKEITFVGIDGDISSDLTVIRFPNAILRSVPAMTDPSQLLMDVSTKKADVVILDPVTADYFMKSNPNTIKQVSSESLAVYPIGMSVKWGEDRLKNTLSRATEMAINIGLADVKIDSYDKTRKTIFSPQKPYEVKQ